MNRSKAKTGIIDNVMKLRFHLERFTALDATSAHRHSKCKINENTHLGSLHIKQVKTNQGIGPFEGINIQTTHERANPSQI
jgi:hypothetical protein